MRRSKSLRILAVLPDVPWPLNSGKRIREWSVVSALSQLGEVDALTVGLDVDCFTAPPGVPLRSGASVTLSHRSKPSAAARLLTAKPWRIAVADWAPAIQRIRRLNSLPYDLVWFGSLDSWVELKHLVGSAKVIVDTDDIETEKIRSFLATAVGSGLAHRVDRIQARIERVMWARIQKAAINRADAVTVCSQADAMILASPNTAVVPNCFPDPGIAGPIAIDENAIVMVGNYSYEPNLDGARFMAHEVIPRVRASCPDAQLRLVGRGAPDSLAELGALPGVVAIGEVESTTEYLQRCAVAVAPIRFGGGTRIKLIEAFASARPTVSTTVGCHGLAVTNARELLVADGAAEFAEACTRILKDPELAAALGAAGHKVYTKFYEPSAVISTIQRVVTSTL